MILDILTCEVGTFIADNTANSKPIVLNPLLNGNAYQNKNGYKFFQIKDNFTIKSIALFFPYCFSSADALRLDTYLIDGVDTVKGIDQLSTEEDIYIYNENAEIDLNLYVPFKSPQDPIITKTALISTLTGNVNTLNAPDSLNNLTLTINAMIKIEHTLPLEING